MPLPLAEQIRPIVLRHVQTAVADPLLDTLIATADVVCAHRCLFPVADSATTPTLESAAYTLYPLPWRSDPSRLVLHLRPVTAVTAAAFDSDGDWTYSQSVLADVDVETRGRLLLPPTSTYAWGTTPRSNRVTVTAGYDVAETPDLVLAYGMLVAHWLQTAPAAIQNATILGQTAAWQVMPIPSPISMMLAPHRLTERETHGVAA